MALKVRALPGGGVSKLKLKPRYRSPNKVLIGPARSITVRMPPVILTQLEAAVTAYESDRTEVLKRAVRLIHHCLSGHNTKIVISDVNGGEREIAMMIDGVPT